MSAGELAAAVAHLRTPEAIRERAGAVLARGLDGGLRHFGVNLPRLEATADLVAGVTRERYPDLRVPLHSRWRHLGAGGHDRVAAMDRALDGRHGDERIRAKLDLAAVSVLLDAGAGARWRYAEAETGERYARSEGLAVASFRLFATGFFSSDPTAPWQADAPALQAVDEERLGRALQVSADNPLPGLGGRAAVLRRLGHALARCPGLFGGPGPRVGHLLDALRGRSRDGGLDATELFRAILSGLAPIWPGRLTLGDAALGDVWPHHAAGGEGPAAGLVPLHKLSLWLAYSMVEPLEAGGLRLTGVDRLPGLAEYRNGGLLIDTGVLTPRHDGVTRDVHRAGDEVIVEWRALTVALLDRLAPLVRLRLGPAAARWPLASVLEGGTWEAGRRLADQRRAGAPPITIETDGTVM